MKSHLTVAFAALALALSTPAVAEVTEASVTGGKVAGSAVDGLGEFKGIPFAAPPVGDLRWKAPQPVKPWSGVRQTTHFGDACMQSGGGGGAGKGIPYSEDCLYLDAWTPAKASSDKLPVIVWIYGGGFNAGATSNELYDGTSFAKHGVVFVSISYRVGPFGFLATPDLSKESGHGSGAYGLLDQIAGLKWVQANVAKFGGAFGFDAVQSHLPAGGLLGEAGADLIFGLAAPHGCGHRPERLGRSGGPLAHMLSQLGAAQTPSRRQERNGIQDIGLARAILSGQDNSRARRHQFAHGIGTEIGKVQPRHGQLRWNGASLA